MRALVKMLVKPVQRVLARAVAPLLNQALQRTFDRIAKYSKLLLHIFDYHTLLLVLFGAFVNTDNKRYNNAGGGDDTRRLNDGIRVNIQGRTSLFVVPVRGEVFQLTFQLVDFCPPARTLGLDFGKVLIGQRPLRVLETHIISIRKQGFQSINFSADTFVIFVHGIFSVSLVFSTA